MGNRACVIFTEGEEFSPVVYLHWHGRDVPTFLKELKVLMADRKGDVPYAVARFTGICHAHIDGNLSLGIWAESKEFSKFSKQDWRDYSHGDAGVVVVNVHDFTYEAYGGYLTGEAM